MTSPLLHIGFPKCASTFLQRTVFPHSPSMSMVDRCEALAMDRFVLSDAADFDPVSTAAQFQAPEGQRDLVTVVSNENLVGGAAARFDWLVPTADRLAATFPDAKVVIVIREQRSMVLSLYRQLVKRGESLRLQQAISPTGAVGYYPRLRIERLRYHLALETYVARFGAERVRVLPYELLALDDRRFVRELVTFATGEHQPAVPIAMDAANVGYRGVALETRRRLNVASAENFSGPGGPHWSFRAAQRIAGLADRVIPQSLDERWEASYRALVDEVVGQMFVESNRALDRQTGLDLASMGYMI